MLRLEGRRCKFYHKEKEEDERRIEGKRRQTKARRNWLVEEREWWIRERERERRVDQIYGLFSTLPRLFLKSMSGRDHEKREREKISENQREREREREKMSENQRERENIWIMKK